MNFSDLYKQIISKEPYCDLDIFFSEYESFEEIPIVSRLSRLDFLKQDLNQVEISVFLLGLSFFIMNSILSISRTKNKKRTFIAISFTDFELADNDDFIVPNIFIYPSQMSSDFSKKLKSSNGRSAELETIKKIFDTSGLLSAFNFYESRFYDPACNDEFVRVFAVPK